MGGGGGSSGGSLISCVPQRRGSKRIGSNNNSKANKNYKKGIKVVYISNPMKVNTRASDFRALVQELTGQDAELPHDPTKFSDLNLQNDVVVGHRLIHDRDQNNLDNHVTFPKTSVNEEIISYGQTQDQQVDLVRSQDQQLASGETNSFEPLDEVFTPQMMVDNFSAFFPASMFSESALQVDNMLTSLDAA